MTNKGQHVSIELSSLDKLNPSRRDQAVKLFDDIIGLLALATIPESKDIFSELYAVASKHGLKQRKKRTITGITLYESFRNTKGQKTSHVSTCIPKEYIDTLTDLSSALNISGSASILGFPVREKMEIEACAYRLITPVAVAAIVRIATSEIMVYPVRKYMKQGETRPTENADEYHKLPGGKMSFVDANINACVSRKILTETNLSVDPSDWNLVAIDLVPDQNDSTIGCLMHLFQVFDVCDPLKEIHDAEHKELKWLHLKHVNLLDGNERLYRALRHLMNMDVKYSIHYSLKKERIVETENDLHE